MSVIPVLAVITIATLSIGNWLFYDTDMPRYDKFRFEGLVVVGTNIVAVGYVEDALPSGGDDRLCTLREYSFSGLTATREWYLNYSGGQWDDDGYAITEYRIDNTPPESGYIGVGFYQYDLTNDPPQSTAPSGLALVLDDDGDTVYAPHTFRGTWNNACCRDVTYVGDLSTYEEVYATSGWYFDSGSTMRGFIEIAYGSTEISLIEDSSIDGSWEKILHDSVEDLLVIGGFQEPDQDGYGDLRVGCIDLSSTPYSITEQEDWNFGTYVFTEGPLVLVENGLYACMGNGANTSGVGGVALTLWSWDTSQRPYLSCEDDEVYTDDDEFGDYKSVSVFAAEFDDSTDPEAIVMVLEAITDDQNEDYCILIARAQVDPDNMTLGSLTITSSLEVTPESGYTLGARDFYFTQVNPVEGYGCGSAVSSSLQKFWIFEIEDN
ncbi:MAG: hypothetical protein U9P42_10475 [Candidatus Fermentibacteria bacterium]|nr:hypothetical protein [Candidatus Fermentibacteria bacterium]